VVDFMAGNQEDIKTLMGKKHIKRRVNMILKRWTKISFVVIIVAVLGIGRMGLEGSDRFQPKKEMLSSGLTAYVIGECYHTSYVSWLDTSVTLDSHGSVHLLYKSLEEKLVYVNKSGQTWTRKTDWSSLANQAYGGNNAIFSDHNGKIHISSSFSDGGDEDLVYITNSSGEWRVEKVYDFLSVGLENDIAVDSQGNVYILHWYYNGSDLLLSTNSSGAWETLTLDNGSVSWAPGSIMIDSSDAVHVMYGTSGGLRYLTNRSGTWSGESLHTNPLNGVSVVMDNQNKIYALDASRLSTWNGTGWSYENIFAQMLPEVTTSDIYLDEDALALDSQGNLHACFLVQTLAAGDSKELSIYYASNVSGQWRAALVDQWNTDNYNDFPPALAVDKTGNVHLVYVKSKDYTVWYVIMKSQDYYQLLKQDCANNHDIFYEDFNQAFQKVDASQNQWSIGGETWWFPHHNGQAPQVRDSSLVLYSKKNESDSTFIKQEAQTMERFSLPDQGELIIGLWSDRWRKYPSLPGDYWADSSVGLEFFIGSQHYAVVFVYGHLGIFYDPTGDCQHADAVCQYARVEEWSTIAAANTPIALRIAWTTEGGNKTFNLYIITGNSEDTEPRAVISNVNYIDSEALRIRFNANVTDTNQEPPIDSETLEIDYICLRSSAAQGSPGISLSRQRFYFGVTITDPLAEPQSLLINNNSGGTLNWTAVPSAGWARVYPARGTGIGEVSVSVDGTGLAPGTYTGTITISDPDAFNSPQSAAVTLTVYQANATAPPFGEFSTPIDGSTVRSSIPVTGWALDDIGIESIKIYRGESKSLVFIGDAVLVEGARPDVEQAYPGYPINYKAGWGYMMLTNFLPGGGNGTFKIHAIAADAEGHQVTLGTKTILCDNANAVKPFGAIDTPTQGGMVSGNRFVNWGWVLTPQPNRIPIDGSTLYVFVDGVNLGHPTYNIYRADIANLFTGYANSDSAAGDFYLDTTAYENGVHTIQWTATDNAGNTDGIGSRYFTIHNTGGAWVKSHTFDLKKINNNHEYYPISQISELPLDDPDPIIFKRGLGDYRRECALETDANGLYHIRIKELEPIAVDFPGYTTLIAGYMLVGKELRSLPIGSTLDLEAGKFYWQPGPGFVGEYRFVFIEKNRNKKMSKRNIFIRLSPKFTN
jgi:hypothetical protein